MLNTNSHLIETTRRKHVTSRIKVGYLYLATGLPPMNEERRVLFNDTVKCLEHVVLKINEKNDYAESAE